MMRLHHRFALLYRSPDGQALGQLALDANWEPAMEWLRLLAERKGWPPHPDRPRSAAIEPVTDTRSGPPHCRGFEVVLEGGTDREIRAFFPRSYFKEEAQRGSARLVEQEKLKAGETYHYHLLALPETPTATDDSSLIRAEVLDDPYPIEPGDLSELEARSTPFGDLAEGALPIFVPQAVLDQAASQAQAAGRLETGGILIGRLVRDPVRNDLGVEVRAMIPARHAEAERMQITFTADTFADVRHALEVRGREEIMLGSVHSHPYLCHPECPPESRRVCPLRGDFFSDQDIAMHTALFPKAYTFGMVVTLSEEGVSHALFAWSQGRIQQRGFYILDASNAPSIDDTLSNPHEAKSSHETPSH